MIFALLVGGANYLTYVKGVDVGGAVSRLFESDPLKVETKAQTPAQRQRSVEGSAARSGATVACKWQDRDERWRYIQSLPPFDAVTVSTIHVDPQTNVIAGYRPPMVVDETIEVQTAAAKEKADIDSEFSDNSCSPETIKKLFEDAKDIEHKLARNAAQQRFLTNQ